MEKGKVYGAVSQEQIDKWKAKYGKIVAIKVGELICYLRKPTRQEISYASTVAQTNPMKSNEILLESCWLDGDDRLKKDDELFLSVSAKLGDIITIKDAELINL